MQLVAAGGIYKFVSADARSFFFILTIVDSGAGLAAALNFGATAVWVGTRFVAAEEAGASQSLFRIVNLYLTSFLPYQANCIKKQSLQVS